MAVQPTVTCWACSVLIGVPYVNANLAEAFKCGWCGAINKLSQQQYHYPGRHRHCVQIPVEQHWHRHEQQHPPQLLSQQQSNPQQIQQLSTDRSTAADTQHLCSTAQMCVQQQSQLQLGQQHVQQLQRPVQQQQTQLYPQQWQLQINTDGSSSGWQHRPRLHHHIYGEAGGANTWYNSKCAVFLQTCRHCISFLWRWLIIAIVIVIISSVAGTGVFMLLPRLCTNPLTLLPNLAVAAVLVSNVAFYYAASVLQSPGSVAVWVPPPPRGPAGEVLQGSFEQYMFCEHCQAPKPPSAHHCRTCGICVVEMDHHCPFINNCVGRGNLRPFLLFLVWTLAAACYILVLCSILIYQNTDILNSTINNSSSRLARHKLSNSNISNQNPSNQHFRNNSSSSKWLDDTNSTSKTGVSASIADATTAPAARAAASSSSNWLALVAEVAVVFLQYAPGWLLATYYLVAAAVALLLAVGMLLWSQLSYLSRGVTYVQHLKEKDRAGSSGQDQGKQLSLGNGGLGSSWALQAEPIDSRREQLWARLSEVLGTTCSSSCWWPLLSVLLTPRWRNPGVQAGAAAGKKWS